MSKPWIGVDLDGTLAKYTPGDWETIGEPIEPMVEMVACWLRMGMDVRIFTARVSETAVTRRALAEKVDAHEARKMIEENIQNWCAKQFGVLLPITAEKDGWMVELYDDRAVGVEFNTGKLVGIDEFTCFTNTEMYEAVKKALERVADDSPIYGVYEVQYKHVMDLATAILDAL